MCAAAILTLILTIPAAAMAAPAKSGPADLRVVDSTGETLAEHVQYTAETKVKARPEADCFGPDTGGSGDRVTVPGRTAQVIAFGLALAWALLIGARAPESTPASRVECGSDPWDFLPVSELVEPSALVFLVEAHCANAKYLPDGWVELRYAGGRADVELRRVDIGGTTFLKIVSIGGMATQ